MSSLTLNGDTSGSILIQAPAIAGSGTLTLPTGTATLATNGPTFRAYRTTDQSSASGALTKVVFNAEIWDTAASYDTSTARFTPNVAGYYLIMCSIGWGGLTNTSANIYITKNGANLSNNVTPTNYYNCTRYFNASGSQNVIFQSQLVIYFNGSTDYVEVYVDQNSGSTLSVLGSSTGESDRTWFEGTLLRGA